MHRPQFGRWICETASMDSLPVVVSLAAFGFIAIVAGVFVWRGAQRIVEDARRDLEDMFGEQAGLAASPPGPMAARIAGAGFVAAGVALLVVAVVAFITA